MNFLNPAAIAIAAALTVPPLVALYFLKLKRTVRLVPSTLLWKRAVEDLQVNSPFQRLRKSLLLFLQLLVLGVAAFALGKPMLATAEAHQSTVMILIDTSASMSVLEEGGKTRLQLAKEQAKLQVDSIGDDARAMVIAFCDRATVVASFDTDKDALKRKIDSIEQTQSRSSLGEAISLAEAHAQRMIMGGELPGSEVGAPVSAAPEATVFLFTDGKIEDADKVAVQKFDITKMLVTTVGSRSDNVGILAMDASRNYERPAFLEVTAAVENFGTEPVTVDAVLYIDGRNVDVQTVQLDPAPAGGTQDGVTPDTPTPGGGAMGHIQVAAFDDIVFEGGGVIEVMLRIDDALQADDRAWTVIDPPRRARVLLVTPGNMFLEGVLGTLTVDRVIMTGAEYEVADDDEILLDGRSAFDVVILDRHSTGRVPQGNYLFWGAIPEIEGVSIGPVIDDQVIFDWDETHPILRHVAVETIDALQWLTLNLPPEAVSIMDGESTPVMAYLTRDAGQFLISAFGLIFEDDRGGLYRNGDWVASVDFVVLVQNMIQYLASNVATTGKRSISPGEPVTLPVPQGADEVDVVRPDGTTDSIPTAEYRTIHYARTRQVGAYRVEPGVPRGDAFAVNLFNETESNVTPAQTVTLGADRVEARSGTVDINKPAWMYFLLALLLLLLLEWIVYNRRVFV